MNGPQRSLVVVLMLAVLSIVSCNKTEAPPPPPKAEPPKAAAPTIDPEMKRLAGEVYVYAFPMVLVDVTRQVQTAKAPHDAFTHQRALADAASGDVANPNADFLYSQAWLDLSKGPLVVSVPDTRGRYYLIAMIDAWTNVAASIGKRNTGTEKGDFALVGPRWKGTLPAGVSEIRAPTEIVWLFGRTRTTGPSDDAAAARIQDQFRIAPLAQFGKRTAKASAAPAVAQGGVDLKSAPRDQVARMDAATFFTRFSALLPGNPPAKDDAPMVEKIKKLGIVAAQPFDVAKLDPLVATSIAEGAKTALDAIVQAAKGTGSADIRNGWIIDRDLGRWGTDYGKRAVTAWKGLGVNAPEDAVFMTAQFDGGGRRLDGANRYVLHFDRSNIPPADAFWSVAVYDAKQHFVANRINRHGIQSDALATNADGSVDIVIQNADPAKDKEANWLPAPKSPFSVMLRVYSPGQDMLNGRWVPPGIRPAT